eukprot:4105571-Amphidinium_carterae.1
MTLLQREQYKRFLCKVRRDGKLLRRARARYRNDREIVLAAVQQHGRALRYAAEYLQNDRQVVLAAVSSRGFALEFASDALREDPAVVSAALDQEPHALTEAGRGLVLDSAFRPDRHVLRAPCARRCVLLHVRLAGGVLADVPSQTTRCQEDTLRPREYMCSSRSATGTLAMLARCWKRLGVHCGVDIRPARDCRCQRESGELLWGETGDARGKCFGEKLEMNSKPETKPAFEKKKSLVDEIEEERRASSTRLRHWRCQRESGKVLWRGTGDARQNLEKCFGEKKT